MVCCTFGFIVFQVGVELLHVSPLLVPVVCQSWLVAGHDVEETRTYHDLLIPKLPNKTKSYTSKSLAFQTHSHTHFQVIWYPPKLATHFRFNRILISLLKSFTDIQKGSIAVANILTKFLPLQQSTKNPGCIALLCPSSPDFIFTWLALMRAGFSVLLIAPQCTPAAIAHLCTSCNAHLLLHDKSYKDLVAASIESTSPKAKHTSRGFPWQRCSNTLASLISTPTPELLISPKCDVKESDTAFIFHTSGTSTGLPKPIPHSHHAAVGVLSCLNGRQSATFTTTPLYHGGIADCFRAWTSNAMIWLFPGAELPITPQNILRCLTIATRYSEQIPEIPTIKYFTSVPYILQMLSEDPYGLSQLQSMNLVGVGGAALPQTIGDSLVSKDINLLSRFGSAECGFLLSSHRDYTQDKAWQYLRPPPNSQYLKFEQQNDNSGLAELVILKGWPHMAKTNREDGSFATSDLFEKHESLEGAWKYHSRSDSTVTLITGKKFDPANAEDAISSSSSFIRDVLVFGTGRQFPGALVIPSEEGGRFEERELRERVWEEVEKVNNEGQDHTRISRDMVILLDAKTKPLDRSSKGTLLRGVAEKRFRTEIDAAYGNDEHGELSDTEIALTAGPDDVSGIVRGKLKQVLGKTTLFDDDADFYHQGIDSTKATQIRALLQKELVPTNAPLPWSLVYDCGNITRLTQYLIQLRRGQVIEKRDELLQMQALVQEYSQFDQNSRHWKPFIVFPESPGETSRRPRNVVVLTGATGALGAFILDMLRSDESVDKVYCLIRGPNHIDARNRVSRSLDVRRKQKIKKDSKIHCLAAKLGDDNLGLKEDILDEIRHRWNRVTIIHAAWAVNFSLPLQSFVQDHISGVRNLINFALSCHFPAHLTFCSSTASILNQPTSPIPERISENPKDSDTLGYSRSKWVAESICSQANQHPSLKGKIRVIRIGQLTGDRENGVWNMSEAWPLMLSTIQNMKALPQLDEVLSWLPLDIAAKAVIQISYTHPACSPGEVGDDNPVYHLVNNSTETSWKDLLEWIKAECLTRVEIVLVEKWLDDLEKLESHPARALLGLWRKAYVDAKSNGEGKKQTVFSIERTKEIAMVVGEIGPVDEELVRKIWSWVYERAVKPGML